MKNRYIPFGYQMQNGDSVINTEQAATVQHIFYAYTEGQSFKEIAEYLTTSGTAYHFSDNNWNKNIVARILANEIYCGAKGYPAIISKEVYSQAASIRSNKTVTYSAVLKPFRSDMQCACCGERLYWRPRTQQWTCRQCGMWSKPMQPENMAQQIVDRLYQIQQHPEIIHNPKEQCNTRSIEVVSWIMRFTQPLHYQSWMQMQSSTKFCAEQNCNLITAQQGMTIRQQCKSSAPAKNSNPQIHFQNHSTAPSSAKSSYTSIHISTSNCETDRHYNKEEHHEQRKNHRNSSH